MSDITRIEIAINNDSITGAQLSRSNGTTKGINTGANPEYTDTLNDVLGEALTVALTTITQQEATIQQLNERISDLNG